MTHLCKTALLVVASILFAGCATNYFSKFYSDDTAAVPPESVARTLLPYSGKTEIFSTENQKADHRKMTERGYVRIGYAGFEGAGGVTHGQILEQAKRVGADIVLYSSGHTGSQIVTSPFIQYNPGTTSTTYNSGTAQANVYGTGGAAYGNATYSGTSTTTTPGTYSTTMIQSTVDTYEHGASFWRKGRPQRLGVVTAPIPDELRRVLGRNTGRVVDIVVEGSSAFEANILTGDIIIQIGEYPITTQESFTAALDALEGQKVEITLLRNGTEKKVSTLLRKVTAP